MDYEYFSVHFEIDIDGEVTTIRDVKITFLPRKDEIVELNYVQGKKIKFVVESVTHFLSDIGLNVLQQVTISGIVL